MKRSIVLCLILICFIPLVQGQIGAGLDIINNAWRLISMSIDIGNLFNESKDGDLHDKVDELEREIDNIKTYVTVQLFNLSFNQRRHILQ